MLSHTNQAVKDCKQAVQAYEAARQGLRLLYDAREKSQMTKQTLHDRGANRVALAALCTGWGNSSGHLFWNKLNEFNVI